MVNFGWIDGSQSLNRSQIFKFEKFPYPDPDLKTLEQERSLKSDSGHLWRPGNCAPLVPSLRPCVVGMQHMHQILL